MVIVNSILCFILYGYDKFQAKQQKQKRRKRISEKTLHKLELFGGWPGALFGQYIFRHKTRKSSYQCSFRFIIILHILLWIWIIYR